MMTNHFYRFCSCILILLASCSEDEFVVNRGFVEPVKLESCVAAELNQVFDSDEHYRSFRIQSENPTTTHFVSSQEELERLGKGHIMPEIDFSQITLVYVSFPSPNIYNRVANTELLYDENSSKYTYQITVAKNISKKEYGKYLNIWQAFPKLNDDFDFQYQVVEIIDESSPDIIYQTESLMSDRFQHMEPLETNLCLTSELNSIFSKNNWELDIYVYSHTKSMIFIINSNKEFSDLRIRRNTPAIDFTKYTLICGVHRTRYEGSKLLNLNLYQDSEGQTYIYKRSMLQPENKSWYNGPKTLVFWKLYPKLDPSFELYYEIEDIYEE